MYAKSYSFINCLIFKVETTVYNLAKGFKIKLLFIIIFKVIIVVY
jgi:hypothetical protein